MTDTLMTITDEVGTVLQVVLMVSPGKTPAQMGWPTSPKHRFFTIPERPDPMVQRFDFSTGKWVENLALIEAQLVQKVKDEAERRRMLVATPGGMKKTVYAAKQSEVEAYNALGTTVTAILAAIVAMPAEKRTRKFRFALKEQALRGEPNISAAIARFIAGGDRSNDEVARVEAIEQLGVERIRAASTGAAKRAAYTAIVW